METSWIKSSPPRELIIPKVLKHSCLNDRVVKSFYNSDEEQFTEDETELLQKLLGMEPGSVQKLINEVYEKHEGLGDPNSEMQDSDQPTGKKRCYYVACVYCSTTMYYYYIVVAE